MSEVACIKCEKKLENMRFLFSGAGGHQPLDGLAFQTRGHYGSAYFDPMDGSYLEISICDECMEDADSKGFIFYGHPEDKEGRRE